MALDGAFLRHIKKELEQELTDSRVDKIYQPSKDVLVLSMRSVKGNKKLLISARADSPRIHITSESQENPQTPPMLCMLLRKRLSGARLRRIIQPGLERLLMLEFEGRNELGDTVIMTLAVEIMGQYSNIVFIDGNGCIIDAVKRVDASMSSQRLILPGLPYSTPPRQNKLCVLERDADDIIMAVKDGQENRLLSKALLNTVQGVSPIICREIEYLTGRGRDITPGELDEELETRLRFFLRRLISHIREISGEPVIITDKEKKPIDFCFEDIQQYGTGRCERQEKTFSGLLDRYYHNREAMELIRQRSSDLTRLMNNAAARLIKKIYIQEEELAACADRELFRISGDIIQANLYRIPKGASELTAENFYDEKLAPITIKLDPSLSPAANSQRYYKSYQKAKTAEQVLRLQIDRAKSELDYAFSVLDCLSRAGSTAELDEIRRELVETGYLRSKSKKQKNEAPLPPKEYRSESGFRILVGRNNKQNDRLTLKTASKNDLWFHTKDIPGSHTVILTEGREPDENTILFAASLAAANSKARDAGKVPVDYTKIRNVSKPQGAKPGMVIYTGQKTLFVQPARA